MVVAFTYLLENSTHTVEAVNQIGKIKEGNILKKKCNDGILSFFPAASPTEYVAFYRLIISSYAVVGYRQDMAEKKKPKVCFYFLKSIINSRLKNSFLLQQVFFLF